MGRLLARLLLVVIATGLLLLIAEGALSFAGQPSLRTLIEGDLPQFLALEERAGGRGDRVSRTIGGADRGDAGNAAVAGSPAGAGEPGIAGGDGEALPAADFDLHPDPAVGRVLHRNSSFVLHGAPVEADDLGLRRRVDGPRGENPLRIVVLGDSVAFGWGLSGEQTLGTVLERLLADHRAPGARPVEVRTVAVPGWNTRNATSFLFDHWDRLAADIVLFLPIPNDLCDNIATVASGFGEVPVPDLLARDPWMHVGYNGSYLTELFRRRKRGEVRATLADVGPVAVECDLGAESRGRYDAMAATVRELRDRLEAHGCKLRLLGYRQDDFWWLLADRLRRGQVDVPVIPLLSKLQASDVLPTDAHPNASSAATFAAWIAEALVAAGDVPGPLTSPLPQPLADVLERRGAPASPDEVAARADAVREKLRDALRPEIDLQTGAGCLQVYGETDGAGRVASRLLAVLRRAGGRLRIEVEPVVERPDLYPMAVTVEADGRRVGEFVIAGGAGSDPSGGGASTSGRSSVRQVVTLDLPAVGDPAGSPAGVPASDAAAIDVKLTPARSGWMDVDGRWTEVSFRLVSMACVSG